MILTYIFPGMEYIMVQQSHSKSRFYSITQETAVLFKRETLHFMRDRGQFVAKSIELLVVPGLLSMLYWQLDNTFQEVQSKLGLIFLLLFYWNYSCYIAVIPLELKDRLIYKREIGSSMYCATSYITSKSIVRLPLETIYTIIFVTIIYFASGLDSQAACYFKFLLAAWLSAECAVSFGYLTSSIAPTQKVAIAIHIAIILPLFITAGLFINAASVPWYLVWCQWISFYYYAFEMMCVTQFSSSIPYPGCENDGCPLSTGYDVLDSLAFKPDHVWAFDVPLLILLIVLYRSIALFVIYRRAK